ncbi:MAG: tetratricopeptide repeat protein [Anaerolineae bacterium]|nr:MAG: tetratricopeptide repeat protein [Anaerolineae bacterium]
MPTSTWRLPIRWWVISRRRVLSEAALVLARAVGNEVALITLLENLGYYEIVLGNYQRAEAYLVEGENLASSGHHPDWLERLSYFQQMRSEIYLRRGDLQAASDYASRALDTHVRRSFTSTARWSPTSTPCLAICIWPLARFSPVLNACSGRNASIVIWA